mgnify:FL=1
MSPARIGLTVAHGVCTTAAIHLASPAGPLAVAAVVTLALAGLAWALLLLLGADVREAELEAELRHERARADYFHAVAASMRKKGER